MLNTKTNNRTGWPLLGMVATGLLLAACSSFKLADKGDDGESSAKAVAEAQLSPVELKKKHFFDTMRPLVEAENARIAEQREFLLAMQKRHDADKRIARDDRSRLLKMAEAYEVDRTDIDDPKFWAEMTGRVDVLPVELVLVQAANESAWGTSRFAKEGNNYFGQWCYSKGCGIVPQQRPKGASYEVARYATPAASLHSYMSNLNTSKAYRPLRDLRAKAHRQNREASGAELAWGLMKYSERGKAYVQDIRAMIAANRELMQGDEG